MKDRDQRASYTNNSYNNINNNTNANNHGNNELKQNQKGKNGNTITPWDVRENQ